MSLTDGLRQLLGDDVVANDEGTLAAHGGDKWFAHHAPAPAGSTSGGGVSVTQWARWTSRRCCHRQTSFV